MEKKNSEDGYITVFIWIISISHLEKEKITKISVDYDRTVFIWIISISHLGKEKITKISVDFTDIQTNLQTYKHDEFKIHSF